MPLTLDATNGVTYPSWTTATRPASPAAGQMGYNTTTGLFDQYTAGGWSSISSSSGSVIQVVSSTLNTYTSISSSTYTATGLSLSITPKFNTSKILIIAHLNLTNGSQQGFYGALFKNGSVVSGAVGSSSQTNAQLNGATGGTTIASGGSISYNSTTYLELPVTVNYLDSPATTSAITYAMYARTGSGGTVYVNYQNQTSTNVDFGYYASTITAMEVAA